MLMGEGRVLAVPDRTQQKIGTDSWLGSSLLE